LPITGVDVRRCRSIDDDQASRDGVVVADREVVMTVEDVYGTEGGAA
jgi:hypothetical protein